MTQHPALKASATCLMVAFLFCPIVQAADGTSSRSSEVPAPSVTVVRAETSEVISRIPVSGTLVPREEVVVYPRITGYAIEKINVDIGSEVDAGDVLAVLDDSNLTAKLIQGDAELLRAGAAVRQAQSQIDSARAAVAEANATLERSEKLNKSGSTSQATLNQSIAAAASARAALASADDGLDVARAQLVQAQSQRDTAALDVARAEIEAPVGGIISARNVKLGGIASSGAEPMFRITRNGEIEVEAEVIETALGAILMGDPAEATIAGNGTVAGRVRLISPMVDPDTRLGVVRISLEHDSRMKIGTFASGWVTTDRHQGTTVPSTAVLTDSNGPFVQVVENGIVSKRSVVAGILSEDGRREILTGVEPGEVVIARAGAFFRDGDRIESVFTDTMQSEVEPQ